MSVPRYLRAVFFIRVSRIGDENICALDKLDQSFSISFVIMWGVIWIELVIGDVTELAPRVLYSVAETVAWMTEEDGRDFDPMDIDGLFGEISEVDPCCELCEVHRKYTPSI